MSAKALTIIAAVLIGAGALVGFIPVSSQGANCGSAFAKSNDAFVSDLTDSMLGRSGDAASSCTDLRSVVRIPAIVLLVAGLAVLVAAGVVNGRRQTTPTRD